MQHALRVDYDRIEALYSRIAALTASHEEQSRDDGIV
jgi:hypothetical protein